MTRIGFIGDPHLTEEKPSSRTDTDFFATQMTKLEYAGSRMVAEGVSVLCFPGDVFDTRRVSNRVITEFGRFLSDLKREGVREIVTTLGQHDVQGQQWHRYKRDSDLAILEELGYLRILISGESILINSGEDKLRVYGYAYRQQEALDFLAGKNEYKLDSDEFRLALIHAGVDADGKVVKGEVKIDCIADQNIKSVHAAFFGDIHHGFEPYRFKNALKTIAFSTGSMTRMRSSEQHEPTYAIMEVEGTKITNLEFIPFFHNPTPFVEVVKEEAQVIDISADIKERLTLARESKDLADEDIVHMVAEEHGFSNEERMVLIGKFK